MRGAVFLLLKGHTQLRKRLHNARRRGPGYCIASGENPQERRVDLDTTIAAMALTAKEMNSKYKETSEGGLAVSVVLC